MIEQTQPPTAQPQRTNYVSSIIALIVGIGLAVAVSALFGMIGWGGELASQTAGAASGAAPLIIDGVRQRRARGRRQDLMALSRGRQVLPKIVVASLFAFAALFVDSLISFVMINATKVAMRAVDGEPEKFMFAYVLLTGPVVLPLNLCAFLLLALAAGHRLGEQRKRWLLFGIGVFVLVRIAMVAFSAPPTSMPGVTKPLLYVGIIVITPVVIGVTMIGAWWAKRTQAVFNATAFFRRLPDEDQEAALSLLGEAVAARSSAAASQRVRDPTM